MSRPVPEKIASAEVQSIRFDLFDYGYFHGLCEQAVQNYGSSVSNPLEYGAPSIGDSFAWQSGGDLYEYKITADKAGLCDGYMQRNWFVTQTRKQGTNQDRIFYLDVLVGETYVVDGLGKRQASFKEVSELSDAMFDLDDLNNTLRTQSPNMLFMGKLILNPHYDGSLSDE